MSDLHDEDFDDTDREQVYLAGAWLLSKADDLVRHHHDGHGWVPWPDDDAAEVAKQARDLIDQMNRAVQEARRLLADAERPARLRALRRQQQHSRTRRDRDQEREQ